MEYVKNTPYYNEAIQEINFSFGNFYLFEYFVIGEVHEDIVYTWEEHGKQMTEEICELYDQNGKDLIYISNRVNAYSVVPSDWLKFYKFNYRLKGYAVITDHPKGILNSFLEKLFLRNKLNNFTNLTDAIVWAKKLSKSEDHAA